MDMVDILARINYHHEKFRPVAILLQYKSIIDEANSDNKLENENQSDNDIAMNDHNNNKSTNLYESDNIKTEKEKIVNGENCIGKYLFRSETVFETILNV